MASQSAKYKRRHYFIDRKFQVRYLLTFGIPMIIMLCFMIFTLYFTTVTAVDSAGRIMRRNIEGTIALTLSDAAGSANEGNWTVLTDIVRYVRTFSRSREVRAEMLPTILGIFGVGLLLVILQIALLTIFFSHRIAGPVFRFERILREVAEGRYSATVSLRRTDELQDLADALNSAIQATGTRFKALAEAADEEQRKKILSEITL
jgi:HAMP domain-containing protein